MLLHKETAAVSYFSGASDDTMPNEALIWKRTQNNSKSFAENYEIAEQTMLDHPKYVFFGPALIVESDFINYPCKISVTSKILVRVSHSQVDIQKE